MIRKHVRERQERQREAGKRDMAARCGFCRRGLPRGFIVRHADGRKFCNESCEADDVERTQLLEARR